MIISLITLLKDWNDTTDSRKKMQHTYVTAGVTLLIVAGLASLVNYDLGQLLLHAALIAIAIFFINAIVWALLTAFVILPLNTKATSEAPAAKPRKSAK